MRASENGPDPGLAAHPPLAARVIATGFFVGYLPWATGTFGSLLALMICMIPGVHDPVVLGVLLVIGLLVGVPSAAAVARAEGHRITPVAAAAKAAFQGSSHSTPDPSSVVIDEIVGMWVTLLFVPHSIFLMVIGFFLFRVMDIIKPQPARYLEKFPHGWGIMLDDVAAGIYANILLQLLIPLLRSTVAGAF